MLAELALYALTPASSSARRIGLHADSIGLWSRSRRRRREWAAHEARCHAVVRAAMRDLPARRTILILGSGLLRDVPFDEIEASFERILLVDAVHPLATRWRAQRNKRIKLISRDLTGAIDWITARTDARGDPVGDFARDPELDLVVSANLLSQLPIRPERWLEKHPTRARALPPDVADRLIGWHLDDLRRFACRVTLLTDVVMIERRRDGEAADRLDLLRGHGLPPADERWEWTVAPFGEIERDCECVHRVSAYIDFARSSCLADAPRRDHGDGRGACEAA
jgi:hypothetical protein